MINFCFDTVLSNSQLHHPNLGASYDGDFIDFIGDFSTTYPYSDPPRLLEYLDNEYITFGVHKSNNCPNDSFYIININFFDHSVDWFGRMSAETLRNVQKKKFKILFYYCEGDSPERIRNTLYKNAKEYSIDQNQIHFILHSTVAKQVKNFYYFNDDEILFKNAQQYNNNYAEWHNNTRTKKFTCLIRSHKNWRFVFGAKLLSNDIYKNTYGSYNKVEFSDGFNHTDDFLNANNNPLRDILSNEEVFNFKSTIPFSADNMVDDERNDYESFVEKYFTDAYWNIVCETHLNLDNTIGTFITEKTWKPIMHNQPFIIMGTIGSLAHLQELGYQTFDGIIDESYDYSKNDLIRFEKVMNVIQSLNSKSLHELNNINQQVKEIVQHNSSHFNESKRNRLLSLIKSLINDSE